MPIVREKKSDSFGEYLGRLGQTGKSSFPVVLLPVLIFTSLYSGLITPTEVAVLGVVYVVIIGYFYKALNWTGIKEAMISTAVISGAVTLMFYFTETASRILIMEGITEEMGKFIVAHSPSQAVTLLMLNVILLLMGMMMNDLSGTVLSAGLLWPIAQVAGIDPYHFAAITGVNLGLGTVTPAHGAHAVPGREDRQLPGRGVYPSGPCAHVGRNAACAVLNHLLAGPVPIHTASGRLCSLNRSPRSKRRGMAKEIGDCTRGKPRGIKPPLGD